MESYSVQALADRGVSHLFVQDNHSLSTVSGTLRGIHFQNPPHAQAKLVRCTSGRIFDVVVDLRRGSPTYGKWQGVELSGANCDQLYVPVGYGHAFLTLEPDTQVIYKVSDVYAPDCDSGVRWDDPDLAISWPETERAPVLSPKDQALPDLARLESPFEYDGRPMLDLGKAAPPKP
jgi:dTDP-4-dehydrorhamnose 3,5-epimerase